MNSDRLEFTREDLQPDVIYDAGPQVYNGFFKNSNMSLSHELQRMNVDSDVIMLACDEMDRLGVKFRKGKKWMSAMYHCLDVAYRQLDIPIEPRILADKLGITPKDVNRFEDDLICSSMNIDLAVDRDIMYCECDEEECICDTLGEHRVVFMDPCYYIDTYCDQLGIFDGPDRDTHVDRLAKLSDVIKFYIDDYPQVLAAGAIQFYCQYINIPYPKDDVLRITRKSHSSIIKVSRILRTLTT